MTHKDGQGAQVGYEQLASDVDASGSSLMLAASTPSLCSRLYVRHARADEAQVADVGADDATRHACCRFGRQMGISAQPLHREAARALPVLCRKQDEAGAYTAPVSQAGRTYKLQAEHLSWHRPSGSEIWASNGPSCVSPLYKLAAMPSQPTNLTLCSLA